MLTFRLIHDADIRIPPNYKDFLSNVTKKERLFEIIEHVGIRKATSFGNKVVYLVRKASYVGFYFRIVVVQF